MPEEVERKLRETAAARGYSEARTRRYVFGTLAKIKRRQDAPGGKK